MPFTAVAVATAIASCVATLAMGLFTNLPFALAPGLGINAVVAFDIVLGRKLEWPVAMSIIVIEGLIAPRRPASTSTSTSACGVGGGGRQPVRLAGLVLE